MWCFSAPASVPDAPADPSQYISILNSPDLLSDPRAHLGASRHGLHVEVLIVVELPVPDEVHVPAGRGVQSTTAASAAACLIAAQRHSGVRFLHLTFHTFLVEILGFFGWLQFGSPLPGVSLLLSLRALE